MNKVDRYLQAATRQNTQRSYQSGIRHFEEEWGGFLPASADSVARYLADYADKLALNTLRQRLAAIAQWHITQGFPDPCKAPVVRKVLKGIQTVHPAREKQATPLLINDLQQTAAWLDQAISQARNEQDDGAVRRHTRDKALLLLGFWRGFRGDELVRLRIEDIELVPGQGMLCYLSHSKTDRQARGQSYKVPALAVLCPVSAYTDWITLAGLDHGPVFRGIDRWGRISDSGLHINSLVKLLRSILGRTGLAAAEGFSSHSLRRGFAGWASQSGWDIKTLMAYVGWKDVKSAMRYIDAADPFARQQIEASLLPALSAAKESISS